MGLRKYKSLWTSLVGKVVDRKALGEAYYSLYSSGYLYPIPPFRGVYYVMSEEERGAGRPSKNPLHLLSQALSLRLDKKWHFTGHTAYFLLGLRDQPPSVVEVANTQYSGQKEGPFPIRFYRISSIASHCGVVEPYRTATPERVNADFLYLYLRGRISLSEVPGFDLPPCASSIHPLLTKAAEIFTPPPIPFKEVWRKAGAGCREKGWGEEAHQALYVDALLSLSIPYVQRAVGPFLPTSPLILKGGTAITKAYLGHYRFSYDMDFSYRPVKMRGRERECRRFWLAEVRQVVSSLGFSITSLTHSSGGRISTLHLSAPFLERAIKLTVSCLDGRLCKRAQYLPLRAVVEEYTSKGWVMHPSEILAEKIRALATRSLVRKEGSVLFRDVVDVHYLRKRYSLDRDCLLRKLKRAVRRSTYKASMEDFLRISPELLFKREATLLRAPPPEGQLLQTLRWAQRVVREVLGD